MADRNKDEAKSKEEDDIQEDLIKKIKELDEKLAAFKQAENIAPEKPKNKPDFSELPVINTKGNKVLSIEEVRKNYESAPPVIRTFQLPFCYSSVIGKIKFWLLGGAAAAFSYEYIKTIQNKGGLKDLTKRKFLKSYFWITCAGITYSLVESYFFDDYCDISSYHYNENMNRKVRLQRLKETSREL